MGKVPHALAIASYQRCRIRRPAINPRTVAESMMGLAFDLNITLKRDRIYEVADKYKVKSIRVFGSQSRDEEREDRPSAMKNNDQLYLQDMLTAIEKIQSYVESDDVSF